MSPSKLGELLLEIRAEEIPARMLAPAVKELAGKLFEDLTTRGIAPRQVETGYTPRRLVVVLKGLAEKEPDREEQVVGPPVSVAFKKDGTPTPAALGFAKRCGIAPEALERVHTEKGEYLGAVQHTAGRATVEVLAELIPQFAAAIHWPKWMRWGSGEGPWVRPVHGLLALFDGQVVPCALFGVEAANTTVGHPVLSPDTFPVTSAEDYHGKLAERQIFVRPAERRRRLQEGMAKLATAAGGKVVEDEALLDRLTAMCDIPGVLEGRFEGRFLDLPREVLVISLKDHQSAFTVEDAEGALLPIFLTLMDRPDDPIGRVRSGNEWVVAARLADGRFFHDEDRKKTLPQHAEGLERLTFHVKLGSYAAKTERLVALSETLCRALGETSEIEESRRAAALLKADLVTEMVKEFTDLQGIVGGIYARDGGEPPAVWQAIYDQYLPASQEDALPRGIVGRVTALADRLDTLAGMFGLGLIPSGSKDPFGLRRAAQGVVRILLEGELSLDWEAAVTAAVKGYGDILERSPEAVLDALRPFLLDRVKFLLGRRGLEYDEIEAALLAGGVGHRDLPRLAARAEAVQQIRGEASFLAVVHAAKRIANILKEQPPRELDPSKLVEPAEKALYAAYQDLEGTVSAAVEAGDYRAALEPIGGLAAVLETFFTDVMVMAKDEELRNQRIALLQAIDRITSGTAKLTELVVDKAEHR